jgi:predicted MFS family arabinose efflux permease
MDKELSVTFPQLGMIAATRGAAGVGAGLLIANMLSRTQRKKVGLPLLAFGALSTIPIALYLFRSKKQETEH